MLRFLLSIRTFLWLAGVCAGFFIVGSFFIPRNLDVFSEINEMPLFAWISKNTSEAGVSFWIYALIVAVALMAVNLLVCTVDALLKRGTWRRILVNVSPHVLHIGVLLVLLGHLMSASSGYKVDLPMSLHEEREFKEFHLGIREIEFVNISGEDSTRWRVHLDVDGEVSVVEPARPFFRGGVAFFAKSAQQRKMTAIVGVVYDPGVPWEVAGALLFLLGSAGILYSQLVGKKES